MEEPLSLLIRSPAQRHRDLRLSAEPAWTVRRLKTELRRLLPDAPPEENQKLIYSGKLLLDHHCLRELLPKHGELHALHLVYNFKAPANMQETKSESVAPGFSAYTTYSMLQMSWFQQIYARQYYMQYLASTAASADPSHARHSQEIPVAPVTPQAPLPDPFPAQNQPGNQNVAAQVNAVADQNLRMNAQGGPLMEDDEEGGNRDWLDWLYSATLLYVFVNMVYFYSSISRLLLVMGGTVLMYLKLLEAKVAPVVKLQQLSSIEQTDLHHAGWFPFRRRPVQPFPGNVPPQAALNQDQNNNFQGENGGRTSESETPPDEGQAFQELQQANPSLMSTLAARL
ncbi:hypothetical protein IHE44_0002412 [Lamprotornis superbus]|uniref:Ubiquitin-like domain-containing protein n=1 Tax=Lamprotornis superbus TaxID=245042 RepID=A0A835TXD1_9PASS|nr:hypothetical protein IHE44_0002412 [Lamprotornis superbus]